MKNKFLNLLFLFCTLLLVTCVAYAEENEEDVICKVDDQVRLGKAASAVKVQFEPIELEADGYNDENSPNYSLLIYALDIKVYNVTDEIIVFVEFDGGHSLTLDSKMNNSEGVIVLRDDNTSTIKNYTFTIVPNHGLCGSKTLRTIRLTTPKYNPLSDRAACAEVPSYYKCQMFTSYDFETGNYVEEIEAYKEKLAKQGIKNTETKKEINNGVVNKTLKKVSDNKWVVLAVILVIGVAITIVIILKRRND